MIKSRQSTIVKDYELEVKREIVKEKKLSEAAETIGFNHPQFANEFTTEIKSYKWDGGTNHHLVMRSSELRKNTDSYSTDVVPSVVELNQLKSCPLRIM